MVVAALAIGLGGCGTSGGDTVGRSGGGADVRPGGSAAATQPQTPLAVDEDQILTTKALAAYAEVAYVDYAQAGSFLKVFATVRNKTDSSQEFHYQVVWIDPQGTALATPTPVWKVVPLHPGDEALVAELAPRPDIKDFQIKFVDPATLARTGGDVGQRPGAPKGKRVSSR